MVKEELISCTRICKNFGSTRALINVDFTLYRGQICGLIGENGSGKSTLTSIFAGVQPPTEGTMVRNGKPYQPANMLDAQKAGVAMIIQETGTMEILDVAENIFIGNYDKFRKRGRLDKRAMYREARQILEEIGAGDIDPFALAGTLDFEDRKIIEIARAMYLDPEILIIDESTTALAQKGRTLIYALIQKMKEQDKGVIFISHDLEELEQVCNTITCLRDGVKVGKLEEKDIISAKMRPLMVGRELQGEYYRADYDGSFDPEVVLDVQHITSENGYVRNFSVQLHKGEILGFGGLADCGMHEVGRMIYGLDKVITGRVVHTPNNREIKKVKDAVNEKIGYVSKDRDNESIILNASIRDNIVMASYKRMSRKGFIRSGEEKELAEEEVQRMRVKCVNSGQMISQLSGGNKQKVAFAKWLSAGSDIFILDCPTRGIDIGVKASMYQLINQFKKEGKSIIMISEELPELIGMSDRMIIMKDGKISAVVDRSERVTDTKLIEYMV